MLYSLEDLIYKDTKLFPRLLLRMFVFLCILANLILKVDFHFQKTFRGQEWNGTGKLVSMHVCHVNRKIFRSVLFRGKLNQVQLFLSFPCGIDVV